MECVLLLLPVVKLMSDLSINAWRIKKKKQQYTRLLPFPRSVKVGILKLIFPLKYLLNNICSVIEYLPS